MALVNNSSVGNIQQLPRDMMGYLLKFVDAKSALQLACTSKVWYNFIHYQYVRETLKLSPLLNNVPFRTVRQILKSKDVETLSSRVTKFEGISLSTRCEFHQFFQMLDLKAQFTDSILKTSLQSLAEKGFETGVILLLGRVILLESTKKKLMCALAGHGHTKALQILLKGPVPNFRWYESPLKIAAEKGHLAAVKLLLPFSAGLDEIGRSEIALEAFKAGHEDTAIVLLRSGHIYSYQMENILLTTNGHLDSIRAFLPHMKLDGYNIRNTVIALAKKGRLDSALEVLRSGPMSDHEKGGIIDSLNENLDAIKLFLPHLPLNNKYSGGCAWVAIEKGCLESAEAILNIWEANDSFGKEILLFAVKNRRMTLVDAYLKNNSKFSDNLVLAIKLAWREETLEFMHALLEKYPLSETQRDKLLIEAAKMTDLKVIKTLVESGPISQWGRGWAAEHLISIGEMESFHYLIQTGPVEDFGSRRWIIKEAVTRGDTQLVKTFLSPGSSWIALFSGWLKQEERVSCVRTASERGYTEIVQALLEPGYCMSARLYGWLSPNDRESAVRDAAKGGHSEIVIALLQDGSISNHDRSWGMEEALEGGFVETAEILLRNGPIENLGREKALETACRKGFTAFVKQLLASGPISKWAQKQATEAASKKGFQEIVTLLESATLEK